MHRRPPFVWIDEYFFRSGAYKRVGHLGCALYMLLCSTDQYSSNTGDLTKLDLNAISADLGATIVELKNALLRLTNEGLVAVYKYEDGNYFSVEQPEIVGNS